MHQILCGFHFKATASQHKQLCSFATYPHFLPILNLLNHFHCYGQSSPICLSCLLFHIPQSWGHKLQFFSPTLFHPLEKQGYRLAELLYQIYLSVKPLEWARIRSAFSCCCYSAKPGMCVCSHRRPVSFDWPSYSWGSCLARRSSPNGHKSLQLTIILARFIRSVFAYDWWAYVFESLCNFPQCSRSLLTELMLITRVLSRDCSSAMAATWLPNIAAIKPKRWEELRTEQGEKRSKRRENWECLCVSEEAWESSVHKEGLRKSSKEEKHDQSSRSSATTVNHFRAEIQKQGRARERGRERSDRILKDWLNLSKIRGLKVKKYKNI